MSDQKQLLKQCAERLREMADGLEEADDLTPDEVTCHRELGGRMTQAQRRLHRLAAELDKR